MISVGKRRRLPVISWRGGLYGAGTVALPAGSVLLLIAVSLASAPTGQTNPPPGPEVPSLAQSLAGYFPVGAAVWQGDLTEPHSELLVKHFSSITPENDMKTARIEPEEGKFNFAPADALVNFAKAHRIRVRGHTLVWHQQNPPWLFEDATGNPLQPGPESKALMLRRLENHIRAVVSRYRDAVYAWDVVNEVIDPHEPDGFRHSPWYRLTGTDYIDTAFRVAHEAAPNAKLYVNDYDTTNPAKRTLLMNLVRDLKARGVPVDGIGHQMHINIEAPALPSVMETIEMFSALGVDNQITELDVSVYDNASGRCSSIPEEALVEQGYRYRSLFDTFRKLKEKISAVTFWGLADDHTWLTRFPAKRLDWPLLFDGRLQPKPAFWGIVDPSRLPPRPGPGEVPAYFLSCSGAEP